MAEIAKLNRRKQKATSIYTYFLEKQNTQRLYTLQIAQIGNSRKAYLLDREGKEGKGGV
jgi:hypothetical protein